MVDFLKIATRSTKRGIIEVYPKFIVGKSSDLMIRGGDFYAIWLEDRGLWSTDEEDVIKLVDKELDNFVKENKSRYDDTMLIRYMWDSESGVIDSWHKYVTKQMRDNYHTLDENLIFSNQESSKEQFASRRLNYPLGPGDISAYEELMSVLYSPEEKRKLEYLLGSVINGASKTLDKFGVIEGAPGTGKSTALKIVQMLFKGYYAVFDSKALGSSTDSFALEAFRNNPLVAIQHDGDLSHIEDNTRLNSLTSHEKMRVNEKHKSTYEMQFITLLLMGTNKPVKITDAKSGIIRRLIDIHPTGEKVALARYNLLMQEIKNELGAIAYHCREVFEEDPEYYNDYKPTKMMSETNDFYNFVLDSYMIFAREDGTTLKAAWEMYKLYCEEAKVPYPFPMRVFKSELMNYFRHYEERVKIGEDWVRSYYSGFRKSIFKKENIVDFQSKNDEPKKVESKPTIEFLTQPSNLDKYCHDCPAQYANADEFPKKKWDDINTKLEDLVTSKIHYVKLNDIHHIVIDFDLKDPSGEKSFERNLEAASKWPKTYAELSKSGKGIHLHYIYDGDPEELNRIYDDDIEIKVFTGNSALRRKLTKCNSETINHLPVDYPLPKRKEKSVINFESFQNEKALRTFIKKNLNKEYHGATKPSVDYIYKGLEDAYNSGMKYDVSDMYDAILGFAVGSTHNADYCIKLVQKMHLKSDEASDSPVDDDRPIAFYDVEVFPNLLLVNWKRAGKRQKVNRLINPSPKEIAYLVGFRLIGFNCRRYDNHILYARLLGYNNEEIYNLSKKIIINKSKQNTGYFQEAYNLSYTDIYDYATKKQSLKKWEIELGLHHQELGLPWDKPVPEERWVEVAEYCDNDVISTEAVFEHTQDDFRSRVILVKLANALCPSYISNVNDTTNTLTTRIIFRGEKNPQHQFLYTNLATGERSDGYKDPCKFPGYVFENGKSYYLGEEIGEGGRVIAVPGMFTKVITLDIRSMHPHSAIALRVFGPYTDNFKELVDLRVDVKHQDWDSAKKRFGGALDKLIDDLLKDPTFNHKDLAAALKIAINSVYGLTSAKFDNAFKDPRNVDNIVAKRGALFMSMLQIEVEKMQPGVTIHVKTDSIKLKDPRQDVIDYVMKRGEEFGYYFEVESKYERICLVNDAVYIAKKDPTDPEYMEEFQKYMEGKIDVPPTPWTATGTQFAVPYVFKKCFSHEPIEFEDLCETKEVKTSMYLDLNEGLDDGMQPIYEKLADIRGKARSGEKLTGPENKLLYDERFVELTDEELIDKLASYHKYQFIGRVGLFCPIKPGCGGGILLREQLKPNGTIGLDSVTGTKGYRWLEAEQVKALKKEKDIDLSYYDNLVNSTIDTISKYGDYEWFVSAD